jgi:hypothetical protein
MIHRSAVTLVEVLVAIFVMGIGLLALLTLFPLAALTMARAIQDERCAQAGLSANGYGSAQNVRNDPQVVTSVLPAPPSVDVFMDPTHVATPADPTCPSYPVFVDPIGFQAGVLIAAKKKANIAVWMGRWDECLARGYCNRESADRCDARFRHFEAGVFLVPARWAR